MKKYLRIFFLGILLLGNFKGKGQWVTIPDTNFVNFLNAAGYGSCLNGNLMDTTCTMIINATSIDCYNSNISNLEGIQYFDNLTDLYCNANDITNLPSLPFNLVTLNCEANDLTSLPNLPVTLTGLYCGLNGLTALPSLPPSLMVLYCESNIITSLPILPSSLISLDCSQNQLTSLPPIPNTFFTNLNCSNNHITSLPILPDSLASLNCASNQLTSLPDLSHLIFYFVDIICGYNQLTSIPELPDNIDFFSINDIPTLTCFPKYKNIASLYWVNTPISCLPNAGNIGSATPSINNLPICQLISGCDFYWNMYGKIYEDGNGNCIKDSNEMILKNIPVKLDSSGISLQLFLTDKRGYYSFETGIGNYQISIDTINLPFNIICPSGNLYNSVITNTDSLDADIDFGVQCKTGYIDLVAKSISISTILSPGAHRILILCAGDAASFYGLNCANGVNGYIQVVLDSLTTYISPAPGALTPSSINGDTLIWNVNDFSLINPIIDFNIRIVIDTAANSNDTACFQLSIVSNNGDNVPSNNTITNCFTIRNSYDPNAKEMYPSGIVDASNHTFTYTIFFQNTGTAPAENIYLLDTLDANLNANTFQYLSSSHDVITQLLPGNILRFSFPNINLPDSTSNEPASHGYVQFKINRNDSVFLNMEIHNKAYIYFDLNPPIETNDVFAILNVDCNSISDLVISDSSICDGEQLIAYNNVSFADLINYTWMLDTSVLFSTSSAIALSGILPSQHSITLISNIANCNTQENKTFTVYSNPYPIITSSNDTLTTANSYNSFQWLLNGSIIPGANQNNFIFNQSGWYSIFVSDSNGCSGFSDSIYLFNCSSLISFSVSGIVACENEIIKASNNSSITGLQNLWLLDSALFSMDSSIIISGLSPGIHSLQLIIDTLNCNLSTTQSITIYSLPNPVFTNSNDSLFSSSTYNSYQWLLNSSAIPGATQNYFVITQSGFYNLQVIDSNGCMGISDSIYVSGTGISEPEVADFTIYPNPADNQLNIVVPSERGKNLVIDLSDNTGRTLKNIFNGKASSQKMVFKISLENFSKGIYLIRVNNRVKYFVKK